MANNSPGDYNAYNNQYLHSMTGSSLFQSWAMTSTGAAWPTQATLSRFTLSTLSTEELKPRVPEAISVSVMADGYLLINLAYGQAVRVPPSLFKDLVTLATLGLVEKLAPQEAEDAR